MAPAHSRRSPNGIYRTMTCSRDPLPSAVRESTLREGNDPGSGANPAPRAPGPAPSIQIENQALLLSDNTAFMTVDYLCLPGSGANTAGTVTTSVMQGQTSSSDTKAPATCDDRSHMATTDNGPGPFSEGDAQSFATALNSANEGPISGGPITISPFAGRAPASR